MSVSLAIENDGTATPASHALPGRGPGAGAIVVSEFPLNHYQSFRAEIIMRDGKPIVSIARWKKTQAGGRRTGQSLEFGAHRVAAVSSLLVEVQRVLDALNAEGARHEPAL